MVLFIIFDNGRYEIVWVKKMANVDKTQRKNQLIPFVKSPIEFFFIKILETAALV
jgi:hypothetical protein